MRAGTIAWGLLVAVIAVAGIVTGAGVELQPLHVAVAALAAAGVALLLFALAPERKPEPDPEEFPVETSDIDAYGAAREEAPN